VKAEEAGENEGLAPQEVLDEVYESQNFTEGCDTDLRLYQAKILLLAGFETTAGNMHSSNKKPHTILITPCILISHYDSKFRSARYFYLFFQLHSGLI
jgi:hypothetical protein